MIKKKHTPEVPLNSLNFTVNFIYLFLIKTDSEREKEEPCAEEKHSQKT